MEPISTRSGKKLAAAQPPPEVQQACKRLRKDSERFLVGHPRQSIRGSQLPTARQVLQFLFHVKESGHCERKREAYKITVKNVLPFWKMARIKTMRQRNCCRKLESLFTEWQNLQKSANRADQNDKRTLFAEKLDRLWDIGATDALEEIRKNRLLTAKDKAEDEAFYRDQQGARQCHMSGQDKIFARKAHLQAGRQERQAAERFPGASREPSTSQEKVEASCSESDDMLMDSNDDDAETVTATKNRRPRVISVHLPKTILKSSPLVEMADRLHLSNNQVCFQSQFNPPCHEH